jgi:glucose/arabinose dehydrogenase
VDYGDAFVSMHGSWNRSSSCCSFVIIHNECRDVPQGFKVVQIKFFSGKPISMKPFLFYETHGVIQGNTAQDTAPGLFVLTFGQKLKSPTDWNFRPVGLAANRCSLSEKGECLFVSSDAGSAGKIVAVGYFQKTETESGK